MWFKLLVSSIDTQLLQVCKKISVETTILEF